MHFYNGKRSVEIYSRLGKRNKAGIDIRSSKFQCKTDHNSIFCLFSPRTEIFLCWYLFLIPCHLYLSPENRQFSDWSLEPYAEISGTVVVAEFVAALTSTSESVWPRWVLQLDCLHHSPIYLELDIQHQTVFLQGRISERLQQLKYQVPRSVR